MARRPSSNDPVLRTDRDGERAIALFPRDVVSVSSARDWLARFLAPHHPVPRASRPMRPSSSANW